VVSRPGGRAKRSNCPLNFGLSEKCSKILSENFGFKNVKLRAKNPNFKKFNDIIKILSTSVETLQMSVGFLSEILVSVRKKATSCPAYFF